MNFGQKTNNVPSLVFPSTSRQASSSASSVAAMEVFKSGPANNSNNKSGGAEKTIEEKRPNFFGKSVSEKTYFFTGTVERLIKWHRVLKNYSCYFEVVAAVVSAQDGDSNIQKIILLKDSKGPILKVIHYVNQQTHPLTKFTAGQRLRVVGFMIGLNVLQAISIREATAEEFSTLKRFCYISDFAINQLVNKEETEN